MKKMWPVLVVLLLMGVFLWVAGTAAIAEDQCNVVGNSYTLTFEGQDILLADFTNNPDGFSPAPKCGGTVTLIMDSTWHNVRWSPMGDHLVIDGITAMLTTNGLKVYNIPHDLHQTRIGKVIYLTEQEIPSFLFK